MSARQIPELRAVSGTSCASKVRKAAGLVSRCVRLSYPWGPEDVKVRLRKPSLSFQKGVSTHLAPGPSPQAGDASPEQPVMGRSQ